MAYDVSLMNRRPGSMGAPSAGEVTKPLFVGGTNAGGAPVGGGPGGGANMAGGGAGDMLKSLELMTMLKKMIDEKKAGGGGMMGGQKQGGGGGNQGTVGMGDGGASMMGTGGM